MNRHQNISNVLRPNTKETLYLSIVHMCTLAQYSLNRTRGRERCLGSCIHKHSSVMVQGTAAVARFSQVDIHTNQH